MTASNVPTEHRLDHEPEQHQKDHVADQMPITAVQEHRRTDSPEVEFGLAHHMAFGERRTPGRVQPVAQCAPLVVVWMFGASFLGSLIPAWFEDCRKAVV